MTYNNTQEQTDAELQQGQSDLPGQSAGFMIDQPYSSDGIISKQHIVEKHNDWQEIKSNNKRPRSSPEDNNTRRNSKQTRLLAKRASQYSQQI